jgi:PadR family transcriptional regulator, regulatory protein AphA
MARENKSRYAILGVLSMGPRTGYEVRKTIESSLANFWNESYGQIYPILRTLVAEGLATSETQPGAGRPDRHVYTITDAGRAELRAWLTRPVEHEVGRVELLLKLFFGWQTTTEENQRRIEEYRQIQQHLLDRYSGIEAWLLEQFQHHPGLPYWLLTIDYGKRVSTAITGWCDDAIATLAVLDNRHSTPNDKERPT